MATDLLTGLAGLAIGFALIYSSEARMAPLPADQQLA